MREVSTMDDYEISEGTHSFFCFRCGDSIEAGEKMVSLSVTFETPTDDDAVEVTEAGTVSTLCQGCASVLLCRAITRDPRLMMPHRASIQQHAERHRQAAMENPEKMNQQNTAQEDEPGETDLPSFYYSLGIHFLGEGDWERAINAFTSVIEFEPENAAAYDRRGIAYGRVERYGEAIADFNRAIELDPAHAGAYNNRGLSYYRQGLISEAIADYDTAIQLSPDIAVFHANRGLAHCWKKDLHVAIADYNRAIELDPNLRELHNSRGEAYAKLGEYEKAVADFEAELSLNPNDIVAYANRVWTAADLEDQRSVSGSGDCEKGD